jgi:hypothetical protein
MDCVELLDQALRPVGQHLRQRHAVRDGEGQVEVGPTIALAVRERTDDGSGDDPLVRRCQFQHAVAHPLTVLDAEDPHGVAAGNAVIGSSPVLSARLESVSPVVSGENEKPLLAAAFRGCGARIRT